MGVPHAMTSMGLAPDVVARGAAPDPIDVQDILALEQPIEIALAKGVLE